MKRFLPIITLLVTVLLVGGCKSGVTDTVPGQEAPERLPKDQRIGLLAEQEVLMTKDPATGEVPKEKLYPIRQKMHKSSATKHISTRQWTALGPNNVGGRTRTIAIDRRDTTMSTIWAGSVSGGLWKCTEALSDPQWTRLDNWPGSPSISSIVQDPNNLETMYVSTGEGWFNADAYRGDGIYKSEDGGDSWQLLEATANRDFRYTQKLIFNQRGELLACTRFRGVLISRDGGNTWDDCLNRANFAQETSSADIEMAANGDLYAAIGIFSNDGVYKSTDDGATWTLLEFPDIDPFQRIEIATAPSDSNRVLVLLQSEDNRECRYILESQDAGETWEELEVPGAIGMDNFARNQAWYDLIAAYHPTDSEVIFIGGVDLHRSTDGGASWQQLSYWVQGGSIDYMHADQHAILPIPGQENAMYFGNDGGVWLSQDLLAAEPDFQDLSEGYISTQFYACSVHPDPQVSYYMAGAQDNGTQAMTSSQMGPGLRVLGGDGAFNHIDGEDGDIRIAAYQRGNYAYTTDGWSSSQFLFPLSGSLFINPTTYDTPSKTMYASYSNGGYLYLEVLTGSVDSFFIAGLEGNRVSALKVDPTNSEVLYVGSEEGSLLRVTNPKSQSSNIEVVRAGSGYLRAIDIDPSNSSRIAYCYSNFNVESIWYSTDRGETFNNIDYNLPEVPVRWISFAPNDPTLLIAATEVGLWELDLREDEAPQWQYVGEDIGPVRVDMIAPRYADGHLAVASYGRGLWATDDYATPSLGFSSPTTVVAESKLDEGECVVEQIVPVEVILRSSLDTSLLVDVMVTGGSAQEGVHYELIDQSTTIEPGSTTAQVNLLVYSDRIVNGDLTVDLSLRTDTILTVFAPTHTVVLEEGDVTPQQGSSQQAFVIDSDGGQADIPFNGFWHDAKMKFFYPEEVLAEAGLVGRQSIESVTFDVLVKESRLPYDDFTLRLHNTEETSVGDAFLSDAEGQQVFTGTVVTAEGKNTITFDEPFEYLGGNLVLEACFDNQDYTLSDQVATVNLNAEVVLSAEEDFAEGCALDSPTVPLMQVPAVEWGVRGGLLLATQSGTLYSRGYPGSEAYYYKADSIVGGVSIGSDGIEDCVQVSIHQDGAGLTSCNDCRYEYSQRQYFLSSDLGQEVTYFLYYPSSIYQSIDSTALQVLSVSRDSLFDTEVSRVDDLLEVRFTTSMEGVYALSNAIPTAVQENVKPVTFDYIRLYDIQGKEIYRGRGTDGLPSGIYIAQYFVEGKPVYVEKIVSMQ